MNKGHCFQCEAKNPPEQLYCGQCGSSLVLKDYISAQVTKGVSEATHDREALLVSDSVEVFERAWKWAQIVMGIMAVPFVAVLALLGLIGYKELNLNQIANNAQNQIETTANNTKADITQAAKKSIGEVTDASGRAIEANRKSADKAVLMTQEVTGVGEKTKTELRSEADNVKDEVTKSKAELQQVHQLQPEFNQMRDQLQTATDQLAAQQKVVSSSEDFVKHVFTSHVTYMFGFHKFEESDHAIIIPAPQGIKNSTVLMIVPQSPLEGTLQLQWGVYMQPPNSFIKIHNLIMFFWGDPPQNLLNSSSALDVTFFADTTDKKLFKKLEVKDGRAYVDGQPFPKFGQPDPDFAGKPFPPEPKD